MEIKEQNILFFTRTMKLGGTENVVLQLCEIFQPLVKKIVVCSCGGVNTEKLEALGIKHYSIPDIEKKTPGNIVEVCRKLKGIIKKEAISVIHTHHRMAAFYVTMLGLYRKCYFFNTSHNTFTDKITLTRYAYKKATLIACGEMVKKNLVDVYGFLDERIIVVHNAIKPFEGKIVIEPLIRDLHENGFRIVGNVGRLSEQKGMEYYIRAIPSVLERCPNTRFLLVGTGEDEVKLKLLAKELQVSEKLFFLGYRSDIQNLMKQMDLIVLSSLWEGLPLTPIEAFSMEKTIVATAVDGTVEIVKDGDNGLLVEARDYESLADKIAYILEHDDLRRTMEQNAFLCYKSSFSFDVFSQEYIDVYRHS